MDIYDEGLFELIDNEVKTLINNIKVNASNTHLKPNGACYNCKDKLDENNNNNLFCNKDCRDDYEKIKKMKRINGK